MEHHALENALEAVARGEDKRISLCIEYTRMKEKLQVYMVDNIRP